MRLNLRGTEVRAKRKEEGTETCVACVRKDGTMTDWRPTSSSLPSSPCPTTHPAGASFPRESPRAGRQGRSGQVEATTESRRVSWQARGENAVPSCLPASSLNPLPAGSCLVSLSSRLVKPLAQAGRQAVDPAPISPRVVVQLGSSYPLRWAGTTRQLSVPARGNKKGGGWTFGLVWFGFVSHRCRCPPLHPFCPTLIASCQVRRALRALS